jgi:hypothetical protein
LETEASKVHSGLDLPRSQPKSKPKRDEESDLKLVESGVHVRTPSGSGGSEIRLAEDEDDDLVLSESGGSDVTLRPGDSGINLVSPSDSGLALDDLDLDLAGSAVSSLELDEGSEERIVIEESPRGAKASARNDDFLLTPLGESSEGDSSSQVIELDSESELSESTAIIMDRPHETAILEPVEEDEAEPGLIHAPLGMAPAVVSAPSVQFTGGNVALLMTCLLVLFVCGIMMLDLVRHIWSWDQPFAINSTLIEALNFFD